MLTLSFFLYTSQFISAYSAGNDGSDVAKDLVNSPTFQVSCQGRRLTASR